MIALALQVIPAAGYFSYGQNTVPQGDTLTSVPADTLKEPVSSAIVSDTGKTADTVRAGKGDIETTISYSADDSIRMDVVKKLVFLYGNARIDYGDVSIRAGEIEINWETNIFTARPVKDSTGKLTQIPLLTQNGDVYQIDTLRYNFKTRKGLISGIVFKQEESYIHGEKVKKVGDNMYINEAKYTTCNLAHPHFYVNAHKLKVIPDDKVISGPFNLVVLDVPTPLGFFLGYFPMPKKKKSGFIIPTIGTSARGFFVREGGYYWAANEYLGVRVVGDIYANGSINSMGTANYKRRYKFNGTFSLKFSKTKNGFEDNPFANSFNLSWTHRTLAKRTSNFSASVNAGSNNYYKNTSYNPVLFQQGVFSSSVVYYKAFANTPININVSARQDQNIQTRVMNFTLPDVTLAVNRVYPFKKKTTVNPNWYQNISFSYTGNTKAFINNDSVRLGTDSTLSFNAQNIPFLLKNALVGAKHSIPVYTTVKFKKSFLKYFNISPTFAYNEYWYPFKDSFYLNQETHQVARKKITGFSRAYDYSTGIGVSTTIYGMYKFKGKKLMGMRHTVIPNVSYSYRPDFSRGNFQKNILQDTLGHTATYSQYQSFSILGLGSPSQGLSSSLIFNINNNLEGKGFVKRDTTGKPQKFMIVEQFNVSGSYNFAADSNKLSPLSANFRTRVWNQKIDINGGSTFDPYVYVRDNTYPLGTDVYRRTNQLSISQGLLSTYNLSIGLTLKPSAKKPKKIPANEAAPAEVNYIASHPEQFVDFDIPWNLFVRYVMSSSKQPGRPRLTTQNVQLNGDIRLTPKWMVTFYTGYDLMENRVATTRIDVSRDLHCWQMSLNIVPFGSFRSYSFTINAKSSILQDLKLNKRNATYYGTYY